MSISPNLPRQPIIDNLYPQSRSLRNRFAHELRRASLVLDAVKNHEDPWFQRRVANLLDGGFYWHPSLDTTGLPARDPLDWEWTSPEMADVERERRAWLLTAMAFQNGHRMHEERY